MNQISKLTWHLIFIMLLYSNQPSSMAHETANKSKPEFIGVNTIANMVENIEPTIVNIAAITHQGIRIARTNDDRSNKMRRYFGLDTEGENSSHYFTVTGSGIVVRSDGKILTNLHVVQNAAKITVTLYNGENFEAVMIAKDSFSDLALLKIDKDNLPVAKFGDANKMRVGDWVIAIGNQFGLGHTVSHGLISGLKREAKGFTSFGAKTGAVRFMQTDASINPGSSGGPLINIEGEIIGINTFIRDDAQNIGFAIPSNYAKEVSDKLLANIHITHPYIGIEMNDPKEDAIVNLTNKKRRIGVEVSKVKPDGPADRAGLEPGDYIITIDEQAVHSPNDVSEIIGKQSIGSILQLKVEHNGGEKLLNVKVDSLPGESE